MEEVYKILRTDSNTDWYLVAAQDWRIFFLGGVSTRWRAGPLRNACSLGSPLTDPTVAVEYGKA